MGFPVSVVCVVFHAVYALIYKYVFIYGCMYVWLPRWWLHLIVVRRFEYASDPESFTSSSVATGRATLAGQVKG
jgi:hypothetical protein